MHSWCMLIKWSFFSMCAKSPLNGHAAVSILFRPRSDCIQGGGKLQELVPKAHKIAWPSRCQVLLRLTLVEPGHQIPFCHQGAARFVATSSCGQASSQPQWPVAKKPLKNGVSTNNDINLHPWTSFDGQRENTCPKWMDHRWTTDGPLTSTHCTGVNAQARTLQIHFSSEAIS